MKGVDTDQLFNNINKINPLEMLSQFGFEGKDAKDILSGNMNPIFEKNKIEDTLDYRTVMTSYGQYFNSNLIEYFFKKAKEKVGFTSEEIKAYLNAYNKWFDFIFQIGSNFIYCADKELKDQSLIIKVDDNYFQMSIMDDIRAIIYIKDYQSNNSLPE